VSRAERLDDRRRDRQAARRRRTRRVPERRDEDRVLAGRVGLEESHDVVVVEGEPGGPEAEAVRTEGQISAEEAGDQGRGPVAAAAPACERRLEVGEEKGDHTRVRAQWLLETELAPLAPELAGPEEP